MPHSNIKKRNNKHYKNKITRKNIDSKKNKTRKSKYMRQTILKKIPKAYRKLIGGDMIGQGNYGCVYRPDVKNKDDKVVSKIVLKHNVFNEYRHEYKILRKMSAIDPQGKFHNLLKDGFELKDTVSPSDIEKCSLTKPQYDIKDFFVFNLIFSGDNNLTYYIKHAFMKKHKREHVDASDSLPAILFTLLTNIIVGIHKMIEANIVHKTLDPDSIFLTEPVNLTNTYCVKIIDFGEGELRKYKDFNDKNQDYIYLFKSLIKLLYKISKLPHNKNYTKTITDLQNGFTELLDVVSVESVNYAEFTTKYIDLLDRTFGEKYSKYARDHYL
jgi:serine/threonine protein kinase